MKETTVRKGECNVCHKQFDETDLFLGHGIRHELEDLIRKDVPDWDDFKRICKADLQIYRSRYVSSMIEEESGTAKELASTVLKSISENELIATNINAEAQEVMSVGDVISDKVATFGGSWKFIITFFVILTGWIVINCVTLLMQPFDPYPFILMNLILSCIAAIQAPIIMMSQNRQEKKDRLRSESDYKVNLKSEIEIRTLHEKGDHLLLDQWAKMMKIQEIQIEILEEIRAKVK
jgi:uncharacterized membrane protein